MARSDSLRTVPDFGVALYRDELPRRSTRRRVREGLPS
jgi:hypothetical protein